MEHRIEIAAVRHKYAASYLGERIGEFRVPECDSARWLLANGKAARDNTLTICRNGSAKMTGTVGWLADKTVEDNEKVSPRWRKFRPFGLKPADGLAAVCGTASEPQVEAA